VAGFPIIYQLATERINNVICRPRGRERERFIVRVGMAEFD